MTDHERIEELIAGYVLHSLSGQDAVDADRLLTEHVPDCTGCRGTLAAFQAVSADLALAPEPMDPPDTLLPALHRELGPAERRSRSFAAVAVAASVVALIGLGGTLLQGARVGTAQRRADELANILSFAQENGAPMVPVGPATQIATDSEVFLFGDHVPSPPPGTVYVVWVERAGQASSLGWFVPEEGWVYRHLSTGGPYDRLFVTIESADAAPTTPGRIVWEASAA